MGDSGPLQLVAWSKKQSQKEEMRRMSGKGSAPWSGNKVPQKETKLDKDEEKETEYQLQ